jgi:Amidohydrolase
MAALEAVVATAPDTTIIGAHVGGAAEDLAWVDRMLATYPNFYVDLGAGSPSSAASREPPAG